MTHEIRLNEDGSLDEVVAAAPRSVHLEQMADDAWWLCIETSDGHEIHIDLWAETPWSRPWSPRLKARAEVDR